MNRQEGTSPPPPDRRFNQGQQFVSRMYLPRAAGLALGGIAIAGVLVMNGAALELWAALILSTIVWPHLALWRGRRSRNPYRTELRSLMVDSVLGGVWIALMQFNLLPSVVILIMLGMDKMAVGGVRFFARCTGLLIAACLVTAAATGFELRPATNMIEIIGSLPLLVSYPIVVGITTYRLARRVRDQNQLLLEVSRTDGLTELLNRRYWEDAVSAEFQRCRGSGRQASLLMLDIDHFKAINDEHGHPVGDDVIRSVAHILRDSLREEDVPGRYGGEEFGAVLPDTPAAGAQIIAERVRSRIESTALSRAGVRATVSIGIAQLYEHDADYGAWIAHADRALYAAKERGRNRSVHFNPSLIAKPEPT
jgi:diguanylate cyclase